MNENFFDDPNNANKEFDADEHLADQGYGGEGVPMPGAHIPVQTVSTEGDIIEDEYVESLAMQYTEEQAGLLDQADSRLEKANLYRMLLNHDLFGDVDCSPSIVNEVQEELKNIILEKLEVLLGMRAEEQKQETEFAIDLPFNALQVEALKVWADKLTKGKSKDASPAQAIVSREPVIKPMGGAKKKPALKKLTGALLNQKRVLPRETVPDPETIARPRKEIKAENHREEWVDPKKMSEDQRLKHNIKNQDKYKSTPSKNGGLPMPGFEQQQLAYQQEIMVRSSQPSPLLQNLQKAIEATQRDDMLKKMGGS